MLRLLRVPLALLLVGVIALSASARVIAPAPIAERVAINDTVILGTVTAIEDKTALVDGGEYKIAIVKVNEAFKGAKDLTHLRVAFTPMARFPANSLQKDLEVLLFLNPVKGQTFHTTRMYYDTVNKNSPMWAKEVESTRQCARALANADKWMQDGKPEEKKLAVAMLILQARPQRVATKPGDPMPVAQSKAILNALAEIDWKQGDVDGPLGPLSGRTLFTRINPMPADGWTPPADFNTFDDAAKKWLKANADKFVFKKFVPVTE